MAAPDEADRQRLEALQRLGVLDSLGEAAFDRIARLAAQLLAAPVAAVVFVDATRAWAKAMVGDGARERPREESLCALGLGEDFFELPDAAAHPRAATLRPVRDGVRWFAGAPIDAHGARVGMLCVCGPSARAPLGDSERSLLKELAALAADALAQRDASRRAPSIERLDPVKTLAAGLAHEINNPLAYVIANLAYAREELAHGQLTGVEEALAEAAHGAARVGELVRGLLTFSGVSEPAEPLDLGKALEAAVEATRPRLQGRARLSTSVGPLPKVRGNRARLEQVFVRLLLNAGQALPEGSPESHRVEVRAFTGPTGQAVAEIYDSGHGIPAEHLEKVFDPFFTTRPVGAGQGLGLSICHGIIAAMGGALEIESEEGRGAVVRVVLPASDQ